MIRRPPRSTRTDTLFPYTTLFRSALVVDVVADIDPVRPRALIVLQVDIDADLGAGLDPVGPLILHGAVGAVVELARLREHVGRPLVRPEAVAGDVAALVAGLAGLRSEEGRGGTGGGGSV